MKLGNTVGYSGAVFYHGSSCAQMQNMQTPGRQEWGLLCRDAAFHVSCRYAEGEADVNWIVSLLCKDARGLVRWLVEKLCVHVLL